MIVFLCDLLDGDKMRRSIDMMLIKMITTHQSMMIMVMMMMMMMMTNLSRHIWVRPRHGHARPLGCTSRPNTVALRMIKIVNTIVSFVIDANRTNINAKHLNHYK